MHLENKKYPVDKLTQPIQRFIQHEKSGGIVLGLSVVAALILSNSGIRHDYFEFLEQHIGFSINGQPFELSIAHWINDALMAVFFFVVGLELKREIVAGELSNPRQSLLPIIAAIGGMIIPALIYILFNNNPEHISGWGIPMATDIALALGVMYLLGNKVPVSLKIFLTALAIVDDLGAVIVIALFYTSDIHIMYLLYGFLCLGVMFIGNRMGIKSAYFYAIIGILGVWLFFLLSGVHATIAAVLSAFMIPAAAKTPEHNYTQNVHNQLQHFNQLDPNDEVPILTNEQLHVLENIDVSTQKVIPPLQRLEHAFHPLVTFLILPIFAISNAGVNLVDLDFSQILNNNVAIGVGLGLLIGKVVGVVGFTWLAAKLNIAQMPKGLNLKNLVGLGFLAAIGFTMSIFVTNLAFADPTFIAQSKIGIFIASIIGGCIGYFILSRNSSKK